MAPLVFVVGGTGAQGIPVIRGLVQDGAYRVRALTRDLNSPRAKQLLALGNVELQEGSFASETDLRAGFRGAQAAFVNIDGFNAGEKTEMFWAMRSYEVALEAGLGFFVYGNLDYVYKKSGYDARFRTGHYDGKGRIGEWIRLQNADNAGRMKAAIFTTGPYMAMAMAAYTPMSPRIEDGVVTWRVPLGDGAVAHVDLDDCAHYVRWLFDHQDRASGLDLEVAIDLIPYADLARAFETVTGHPARYIDTSLDDYWSASAMGDGSRASAYNSDLSDPAAMTQRQNFTGFWTMWKHSGGNKGVVRRDLALLDEIHPGRVKTAEEFFRREDARGRAAGLGTLW
ncbi:NmrA family protein [Verticillium alfalfae VaMs.102]|uniref:NmrA family protein n=1 Tax=Verticillium alfalfae (strain VaMs.102 / ATCC MYA-4576 / FGSC 10136) TaxID=526221 RepID=C9SGP5_VERA1|nr:NmrA family protein [Verticillium alfalfae VaMs.102]EEY17540.1 NmrA family protein [Verticillium alfalfae VaMs.102]